MGLQTYFEALNGASVDDMPDIALVTQVDTALDFMKVAVLKNDVELAIACAAKLANLIGDSYPHVLPGRGVSWFVQEDLTKLTSVRAMQILDDALEAPLKALHKAA